MEHRHHSLGESFRYAAAGIVSVIRRERNMKIHLTVTALVIIFGFVLGITRTEWLICIGLFGLVMALEAVNTAVESAVDLVTEEKRPMAKLAKDAAAGAVLIAAICAAVIGLMIFVPYLMSVFSA